MERTVTLRDQITAGLVAGIAGGIVIEVFLFALHAGLMPGGRATGDFVLIAAVVLGPGAYTNPIALPLGVALHFCVAIGWALGYVYLLRSSPQLIARPWISGAGFGLVVYVFMQIIVLTSGLYHRPPPGVLGAHLVGHIVFYGIPVALIASRLLRTA